MPYEKTYGFPIYDPSLPGGGWDAETWMRYRQQQRGRAYPGQFPPKTEQLARNQRKRTYKANDAIAKIDATLARNELGERPPDLPDGGNAASRNRRSGAQILYDRKVERRARLQGERDRLAAQQQVDAAAAAAAAPRNARLAVARNNKQARAQAGGEVVTPATTIGTPQATKPATGASAYVNPATGIPIAKAAAASGAGPAQIAKANNQKGSYTPVSQPTVKTLTTAEQAAIDGLVGSLGSAYATPGARKKRTGAGEPTVIVTGTPAVPAYTTAPAVRTRSAGAGEPTVIKTAPKTTKKAAANAYAITNTGKSAGVTKKALPAQSKAVDQDNEAKRAKEQQANKLRSSKAWSKGKTIPPPKGFNNSRRPVT